MEFLNIGQSWMVQVPGENGLAFEKLEIKQRFLLGVRVKAEPLSPRDLHYPGLSNVQQLHLLHHPAQLQRPHSANSALSPHLSPNHIGQGNFSKKIHFISLYIVDHKSDDTAFWAGTFS